MKNENVIYKMPKETASELFHADLSLLVKYAFENGSRISAAPDGYLKLLLGATMILAAIGKLGGNGALLELFRHNKELFGATYGVVAAIGVLKLLDVVRMRYHYVKVVRYVNQLRMRYLDSLDLDVLSKSIWTKSDVKMWPLDSISTFAAITLGIATGSAAWICALIFTESCQWAFGLVFLIAVPPAIFSLIVKAKLKV